MAYDEPLANRIRVILAGQRDLTEKKMFGGLAFLTNGNMSFGVRDSELMVRVGPDAYDQLLALPHVRVMDFTGRSLKGYVYVSAAGIADDDQLREWVDRGVTFARTLPAK